jgi:hypothetical protein
VIKSLCGGRGPVSPDPDEQKGGEQKGAAFS